uniref:Kinesin motor domain-containing protein n=1 Tax=Meloidogyne hapla TaxID=6305 RepID=A0A1I8AXR2_MELHA
MLHTNYIGSFYYIAKGINQIQIDVPSQERDLVNKFEHSFSNLLAESNRILTAEYRPTETDVIHARASTTGVHEVKEPESNRHIYAHVTNATDTKNIEFVFGATCDIVLQHNLSKAGMT